MAGGAALRTARQLAAAAAVALAIIIGAGDALAAPGPTERRELPASCAVLVVFEDRSPVAECPDGASFGYEPNYRYWDRRDAYLYTGIGAEGATLTVTPFE